MDGQTDVWRIGEGFMHVDNMFLVRLECVTGGSWTWHRRSRPETHRFEACHRSHRASKSQVQLRVGQLGYPPSWTITSPCPTTALPLFWICSHKPLGAWRWPTTGRCSASCVYRCGRL